MADSYAVTKADKFTFGIWCIQNRGRDPFGVETRPVLSAEQCIRGMAERNVYSFEFHDNDLIPFGASAAQRDAVVRDIKKLLADLDIKATAGTTNLFTHPIFRDGAFTSSDPAIRAFAVQKVLHAIDVAADFGAEIFIFWGGREGTEVDASKDPVECAKWFRDAINFFCEYIRDQGYPIKLSIEPKPNEPRGDAYWPAVGNVLAFIATLDHPDMVGINPEVAHIKMAGFNPYHEFAQALEAGKLLDVHFNGQKPLRYDQDLTFGSDNPKDAFFMVKLLVDHGYAGTKAFDAHPYRTESDPWDFVDRCMRNYKIMEEKVARYNADREIQDLLKELHGPNPDLRDAFTKYSPERAEKVKGMEFDVDGLNARRLPLERLDQLVTEVLLGVR